MKTLTLSRSRPRRLRSTKPYGVLASLVVLAILPGCDSGAGNASSPGGDSGPAMNAGGSPMTSTDGAMAAGPTNIDMIDDMEDGDGSIITTNGRVGAWYAYNDLADGKDTTGTQTPAAMTPGFPMASIDPPRDQSTKAAETKGGGFTGWGAGIGFDLNNDGTSKHPYDASQYTGITFFARSTATGPGSLRVNVQDAQTAPEGGICDPKAAKGCNDHRGSSVTLTSDWKQYTLPFAAMKTLNFGQQFPTFMTDKLFAIQFQVGVNVNFDFWIDDIAFYKE